MNTRIRCSLPLALLFLTNHSTATAADPPPGGMQLLPGYSHQQLQGFDSRPGKISKKGGLEIRYDIGRVTKPGQLALGGDFTDQAKQVPPQQRQWYKEQTIGGQPVHLAYTKADALLVSFPKSGINFSATVKNHEEMADALLMMLSYPTAEKAK